MPGANIPKKRSQPANLPPAVRPCNSGWVRDLLAWYDRHHRDLPWRVPPADIAASVRPDPYRVWLSEIMLQQTNVTTVLPYFESFLSKWPGVATLAEAGLEDVLRAWAGLGYYSRARNLKACADAVARLPDRAFPQTEAELRRLPGVGDYTAAAIAAIAFGEPAIVIDGNVERVVTRLAAIDTPLPRAKPRIREFLAGVVPNDRPGDFAQAMMDIGATICTPRRPRCMSCPVAGECRARREGAPETYPVRAPKAVRPTRHGAAFVALWCGSILLRTRPGTGLLASMSEVPTSAWSARADGETTVAAAPFPAGWAYAGRVVHVFTHFALELEVFAAAVDRVETPPGGRWVEASKIFDEALPSVMKKVIETALRHEPDRDPRA